MGPRSSYPFYLVSYYRKLVTNSWTYSIKLIAGTKSLHNPKLKTLSAIVKETGPFLQINLKFSVQVMVLQQDGIAEHVVLQYDQVRTFILAII